MNVRKTFQGLKLTSFFYKVLFLDDSLIVYMDTGKIWKVSLVFLILGLIPFSASVSQVDVLVVNDGHRLYSEAEMNYNEGMFEGNYNSSLRTIEGVDVDFTSTVEDNSGPSLENLSNYDTVVWYTLADFRGAQGGFTTLTVQDRQNIKDYLDQGGTFYLTGHELNEEDFMQGPESFAREVFDARYRDNGADVSPNYWRFRGNYGNSGSWDFRQVYPSGVRGSGFPQMQYDYNGDVALKSESGHEVTGGLDFMLNTSIEPVEALSIYTDNCYHEEDFGNLKSCDNQKANDGLRLANNIPANGGKDSQIGQKNTNTNKLQNSDQISVSYSDNGNSKTIVGLAVRNQGDTSLEDFSASGKGDIERLETGRTDSYDIYTFVVDDSSDGHADFEINDSSYMAAITVTMKNVVQEFTVSDISFNSGSGDISTSVESNDGDKVIDFIAAPSDEVTKSLDAMSDMTSEDLGSDSGFITKRRPGEDGETAMAYTGVEEVAHMVLNLRKDRTDAEYYVETDGYEDEEGHPIETTGSETNGNIEGSDYPDEYAHTLVSSYEDSHRTVLSSIGFEAIQGQENREKMMNNIIRYLTGPVANNTQFYSGKDIPNSGADESRYTNSTINVQADGINLQNNPSDLENARILHSYAPQGLEPTFESDFEEEDLLDTKWIDDSRDGGISALFEEDSVENFEARQGSKVLVLAASDEFGLDFRNDVAKVETAESIDTSNHHNLRLEFYVSDNGGPFYGPEAGEGEDLIIEYRKEDNSWGTLGRVESGNNQNGVEWRKIERSIPDDGLHSNFDIIIRTAKMNKGDAWLIDDIELNQGMNIKDQYEGDHRKNAEAYLDARKVSENLGSEDTGVNVTYGVQFKDDTQQGYWGALEERWMIVDTVAPSSPQSLSFSRDYTSKEKLNVTLSTDAGDRFKPDLARFTCQEPANDPKWGEWRQRNLEFDQEFEVDITDPEMGCNEGQGNRTVHVQTRDYAGNYAPQTPETWIIYDNEKPDFEGAEPENNSAVTSDREVYITASDNFGLSDRTKYNAGHESNVSFTPNNTVGLDFEENGWKELEAWIYDKSSNLRKITLDYDIDDRSPRVNVTPETENANLNDTAVRPDELMKVEVFDRNFDSLTVNAADNRNFDSGEVSFNPEWTAGGPRDFEVYTNDTAGNLRFKNYTYTVDGSPPSLVSVGTSNESFVRGSEILRFNFSDSVSGVENVFPQDLDVPGIDSDLGVRLGSDTQGSRSVTVGAVDAAGNSFEEDFSYVVDDVPPDVFITNYSESEDAQNGWISSEITLGINATDNQKIDRILYSVFSQGSVSEPEKVSGSGKNVSVNVGCEEKICRKVVSFNANDSAGNLNSTDGYRESDLISIDNKAPDVEFLSPSREGAIESGNIIIDTDIDDPGIGTKDAYFSIYNRSDTSQVFVSGDLNSSNNWDYNWSSQNDIEDTENVTLEVKAQDLFDQNSTATRDFTVENQRTTVNIQRPIDEVVGKDFEISVEANRPGQTEDLKWHNITIEQDGNTVYQDMTEVQGEKVHSYERSFDTSQLDGDGNYTLNTTAESDRTSEYATSETWFYLDTEPPKASINRSINGSWATGKIKVGFEAFDDVRNGSLDLQYRNGGKWNYLRGLDYTDEILEFDTDEYCQDTAEPDCGLRIEAEDAAGNTNSSFVRFKVDNSPPEMQITSELDQWQNSDFQISRNAEDNILSSQELECSVKINSGEWKNTGTCNDNFTVEVTDDCPQGEGSCQLRVRSSHPELESLEDTDEEFYSVDTEMPQIYLGPQPEPDTIVNGSKEIQIGFQDALSGISYSRWDDGRGLEQLSSEQPFEPDWTESGEKTVEILLNDTAGNLREEQYPYTFDNRAPELLEIDLSKPEDQEFGEVRVYRREEIQLNANISENIEMKQVKATVSKASSTWNVSLDLREGNLKDGIWGRELTNESTGLYNLTDLYLTDEAENTTEITSGLPEFRVVNYSEDVSLNEAKQVTAGNQTSFSYVIDLNRTQGLRKFKLFIPPSKPGALVQPDIELENVSCNREDCNITDKGNYLNVSYSGSSSNLSLNGEADVFTPEEDVNRTFITELRGNLRETDIEVRAPNLTVNSTSCNPSCTVDQFTNFSVDTQVINNNTQIQTGSARDVNLEISSENLEDRSKNLGNLNSGETVKNTFSDISSSKAGNFTYTTSLEDVTGSYSASQEIEVQILDVEPPEIGEVGPSSSRININGTVDLQAELDDNVEVDRANLTLEYPNGSKKNLSLQEPVSGLEWNKRFEKTAEDGIYSLEKIYVYDRRGNRNVSTLDSQFKVTEFKINSSVSPVNISTGKAVNFSVNLSGNSTAVESIEVNSTTPEGLNRVSEYPDIDLNNTLRFEQFENSGNYSFDVTATAGLSVINQTRDVFVRYGNSSIETLESSLNRSLEIPESKGEVNLEYVVTPVKGGLRNVDIETSSSDQSVLSTSSPVDLGDVTVREGSETGQVAVTPEGLGAANLSASAVPIEGSVSSTVSEIEVIEEDSQRPEISALELSDSVANINETLNVSASIKDNSVIDNATFVVKHPSNSSNATESFEMQREDYENFSYSFSNLNETGNYTVAVKAWDISGNIVSESRDLVVSDNYSVQISTDQNVYMKGDYPQISYQVLDAGGEPVEDYNLSSKVNIEDKNMSLTEGEGISQEEFRIERGYAPEITHPDGRVEYEVFAEVKGDGNSGETQISFPVDRVLQVDISTSSYYVAPGEQFQVITRWSKPNGAPLPGALSGRFVLCENCPSDYKTLIRDLDTGAYIQNLTAPNESSEEPYSFSVRGYFRGNSESQNPRVGADEPPRGFIEVVPGGNPPENTTGGGQGQASGGGGGGFSSGPSMEITRKSPPASVPPQTEEVSLSVNTNIAAECVYSRNQIPEAVPFEEASRFQSTGGVNHTNSLSIEEGTTYSFSVMCASDQVNSTQEIIFSTESLETFTFAAPTSITPGNESVTQFGNNSARVAIYNEKNEPLTVDLGVEGTCCNLTFESGSEEMDSVTIPGDGETNLDLQVYAPLYVEPGSYSGTLTLTSSNENTSRPFTYQVTRHPAVDNFTELQTRAGLINSSINEYRSAGIDTSKMRKAFENITGYMDQADEAIQRNNLEGLKMAVSRGRAEADMVRGMLDDASWKKYVLLNWWKWAAMFVAVYILFFLIVMVGIPYYRIQTEITRINSQLESAVEARKKGEKQYFQRKIDKDTFNKMMTERQNEVLQLRGEKEDLKEELDGFLMEKLTVENYLKAPWKGMNELEKWWAANRKARENLGKDEEKEEQ